LKLPITAGGLIKKNEQPEIQAARLVIM